MPMSHDHAHELPLSAMARSAEARLLMAVGVLVLLWLAVGWAASLP